MTYVLRVDESRFAFSLVGKFLHRGGGNPPTGGTPEKKPEENTQQQKGREGMADKISLYIEDSFFFRLIHGFVIWFWGIWSQSLTYRAYRRLGQAVGQSFWGKRYLYIPASITGTIGFVPQGDGCPICSMALPKDVLWRCRKKKALWLPWWQKALSCGCVTRISSSFAFVHWQLPFPYCLPCCKRYWRQEPLHCM